jgi:hypothetical protein
MGELTNPFTLIRHWLKFEILELEAIFEALYKRNEIEANLRALMVKYNDGNNDLKKLESSSLSLTTLIMSKEKIEKKRLELRESLPQLEIEITNTRLHLLLVSIQTAQFAIPFF